jgi:hypothetical protein
MEDDREAFTDLYTMAANSRMTGLALACVLYQILNKFQASQEFFFFFFFRYSKIRVYIQAMGQTTFVFLLYTYFICYKNSTLSIVKY